MSLYCFWRIPASIAGMTDQLDLAFAAIRKLDPARQEEVVIILQMLTAGDDGDLTPEDEIAIAISEAVSGTSSAMLKRSGTAHLVSAACADGLRKVKR
jgi:hypothetical protein